MAETLTGYIVDVAGRQERAASLPEAKVALGRMIRAGDTASISWAGQVVLLARGERGGWTHRDDCPCNDCAELLRQVRREREAEAFFAAEARTWFPEDEDDEEEL